MKNLLLSTLSFFGLVIALSACATKPPEVRQPSSEMKILADKYEDAKVYFCTPEIAMVTVDPNKCGAVQANGGKGCREAASYNSGNLKAVQTESGWDLVGPKEEVVFKIARSENEFTVTSNLPRKEEFKMNWTNPPQSEIELFKKYLRICN